MAGTDNIRTELLLSVQRALLGAVPANLRSVSCDWEETEIRLRFIFDGEIRDDDREDASVAATEVIADFIEPWTITQEIERLDYPSDMRDRTLQLQAYQRKEASSV